MRLWCHDARERDRLLAERHPPGVPELVLPDLPVVVDLAEAVADCDAAVIVIPAQAVRGLCADLAGIANRPRLHVVASKGIDLETLRPLSSLIEQCLPGDIVGVISGPCIAREVAQGVPTSVVAACGDDASARRINA